MSDLFQNHAAKSGPVECLGQTFPSDDARREHFTKLLAEKLKDPAFRKIEGFPQGTDEAILAMSDPPYYTACPNPFLEDFVRRENFGGFPFIDMGVDLGVDKPLQGFLDFEVFVGELHGCLRSVKVARKRRFSPRE